MLTLDHPIELQRPPVVRFGAGQVASLADWIAGSGATRPFVVADRVNAARIEVLRLADAGLFGEVKPEPNLPNLETAVAAARAMRADAIVGFGGGSAMNFAKLVAVLVTSELSLRDISGPNRAPARTVKLAQVPTTAGTGSEVGTRALITDPETANKIATESWQMLADIAIVDPELTVSVPPAVTAATGVDAMAHCVEAFTSRRAHPIVDAYALRGIELVGRYLRRAVEDGTDIEARAGMSLAAFYGGICLGPVNTTAGHALAYPLGTRHKLAHGLANALMFPHVLAANFPGGAGKDRPRRAGARLRLRGAAGGARWCTASAPASASTWRSATTGCRTSDLPASAREARGIRAARLQPGRAQRGRHPGDLRGGLLTAGGGSHMTREAFVAPVTCFHDDETLTSTHARAVRLDWHRQQHHVHRTNRDFTALTFEEKVRLIAASLTRSRGRRDDRQCRRAGDLRTVLLAREFEWVGFDGIAASPRTFIACTQDGLIRSLLDRGRRGDDAGLPLRHPRAHPEPHRADNGPSIGG